MQLDSCHHQKYMIKEFFLFIFSICTKTLKVRNFSEQTVTWKESTIVARKPDEAYDIWVCFLRFLKRFVLTFHSWNKFNPVAIFAGWNDSEKSI